MQTVLLVLFTATSVSKLRQRLYHICSLLRNWCFQKSIALCRTSWYCVLLQGGETHEGTAENTVLESLHTI